MKYIKFLWAEIVERYNAKKNDTWYQLPKDVIPIVLNPITGTVAHQNEYKKALYFRVDNLPWYIFSWQGKINSNYGGRTSFIGEALFVKKIV